MTGQIFSLKKENSVGIVTFNVFGDSMNTWTEAAVISFRELLVEIKIEKDLSGAIIISGKPDNFCAGANLKMIENMTEADEVRQLLNTLQDSFNSWNDGLPLTPSTSYVPSRATSLTPGSS